MFVFVYEMSFPIVITEIIMSAIPDSDLSVPFFAVYALPLHFNFQCLFSED